MKSRFQDKNESSFTCSSDNGAHFAPTVCPDLEKLCFDVAICRYAKVFPDSLCYDKVSDRRLGPILERGRFKGRSSSVQSGSRSPHVLSCLFLL